MITGTGTTFCAGFDLKEFAQSDLATTIRDSSRRYHVAVWGFAKPTIAAVNGAALGGGFDLSLLCDLRIATPDAEFGHPEIKFGAPPLFTPLQFWSFAPTSASQISGLAMTPLHCTSPPTHSVVPIVHAPTLVPQGWPTAGSSAPSGNVA